MSRGQKTPDNKCKKCGGCCEKSIIEISEHDVLREPRLLKRARLFKTVDGEPYEDPLDREYMLQTPCPFLLVNHECEIYPTRPNVCVGFKAGGEQCKEWRVCKKKSRGVTKDSGEIHE